MNATKRCRVVFASLHTLGREAEISQWWQDLAFRMFDDAAHDGYAPSVETLSKWLNNYA